MTEFDFSHKPSRTLWLIAGVAAFALHAGGVALALSHSADELDDDALGAPAIEVGLEMMSPKHEASDLPPGPDTDASAASPALNEQKAEVQETDLPKDTPQETEEPDRVVTEQESKKPDEEQKEKAVVQQQASTESVAAEATAMPSNETAKEGPRSVAPAQGVGQAAQRIRATWQKELVAYLDKHKRYPKEANQKNVKIVVGFELDRLGHVLSTRIVEGSGDAAFDQAALDMVKRADPVPAPPPLIADEGLTFSLPVIFRTKGKG
ncbi:energy transducer TonB [Rhodopseudomonas sp. HC1]|uniref:TonB family protein n=1 Tax=Rhodopseudomonas infernalis TaxID=2897386 RepID=UPI001EE93291|nr:energy transducer TonB [Rhodopseudomonas infernalis]MCG6206887.1 energy transducer TonB [Rhodopseudomonas infernalis]